VTSDSCSRDVGSEMRHDVDTESFSEECLPLRYIANVKSMLYKLHLKPFREHKFMLSFYSLTFKGYTRSSSTNVIFLFSSVTS